MKLHQGVHRSEQLDHVPGQLNVVCIYDSILLATKYRGWVDSASFVCGVSGVQISAPSIYVAVAVWTLESARVYRNLLFISFDPVPSG